MRAYWACLRMPEEARGTTVAGDGKSSGDGKQLLRFEESPGHRINVARETLKPILTPFPSRAMGITKNIHVAILMGSESSSASTGIYFHS